ncbi:MAG: hypothetical protein M3335_04020, partial [Actinomycetota bacterium]|nr:hypothetical protein [Actinomycetota bacterium]
YCASLPDAKRSLISELQISLRGADVDVPKASPEALVAAIDEVVEKVLLPNRAALEAIPRAQALLVETLNRLSMEWRIEIKALRLLCS